MLRDEGRAYAARMSEDGVDVESRVEVVVSKYANKGAEVPLASPGGNGTAQPCGGTMVS